jgi:hypothetical protein
MRMEAVLDMMIKKQEGDERRVKAQRDLEKKAQEIGT